MNNSIIPPFNPMMFDVNTINEKINSILKQLFKDKINRNFLIKIKNRVITKLSEKMFNYYPNMFNYSTVVTGTEETLEYDICRIIIGTHRHHSIFLSKEEIRNNEKSEIYQKQLVEEVIEKIKIRLLAFRREKP